jgi:predicted nuclease of predicted toxin-antitoxin system
MKLYLDDDSASPLLAKLLQQVGHDVKTPTDVGLSGEDDPVHLRHAALNGRVIVTGNHKHFLNLHALVVHLERFTDGLLTS